MSTTAINRKRLRALLSTLREMCIYRQPLVISDTEKSIKFIAHNILESDFRNITESKILLTTYSDNATEAKNQSHTLLLHDQDELFALEMTPLPSEKGTQKFSFCIANAKQEDRRSTNREQFSGNYFVPATIKLNVLSSYPVSCFVRLIDFDSLAISFEIRLPYEVSADEILGAQVTAMSDVFAGRTSRVTIDKIRQMEIDKSVEEHITTLKVVSKCSAPEQTVKVIESIVQPNNKVELDFKLYLKNSERITVEISTLLINGFISNESKSWSKELPRHFLAELYEHQLKFTVENQGGKTIFRLLGQDVGTRIQWYNLVSEMIIGVQCRLRPDDAKEITRLMLESGGYSLSAISNIVMLHGFLKAYWPVETSLPKTKLRWVGRDKAQRIIGHASALRVTDQLWAVIDDIGSQSYEKSWNKEYFSTMTKVLAEAFKTSRDDILVQWTYSPTAGVWARFEEELAHKQSLVVHKHQFLSCYLDNLKLPKHILRENLTIEAFKSAAEVKEFSGEIIESAKSMLNLLLPSDRRNSDFLNGFKNDYGIEHQRHYKKIVSKSGAKFLVTFTNYPYWSSLNKGQDWVYVFPTEEVSPSKEELNELISAIKACVFEMECIPYRVAIVGNIKPIDGFSIFQNLILKPSALEIAAKSIEDAA